MSIHTGVYRKYWRAIYATMLAGLANPGLLASQQIGTCKWGDRIRLSVLFDNSGTVIKRERALVEETRVWMTSLETGLRPHDRFQVHSLLPRRSGTLKTVSTIDVPDDFDRVPELRDSADALTNRLFARHTAIDTTDLTESLRALQQDLEQTQAEYCADFVILATDGSLSPFRDPSGGIISPSRAINDFVATVVKFQRQNAPRFHYYAVGIGAARAFAVDTLYRNAWERDHGRIAPEQFEMQGDSLLKLAFGRIYNLSIESAQALVYNEPESIYATAFALQRERDVQLHDVVERNLRYILIEETKPDASPSLCESPRLPVSDTLYWTLVGSHCLLHASRVSTTLLTRFSGQPAPWFAFSQQVTEALSSDTVSDPHQIVLEDVAFPSGSSCTSRDLFYGINTKDSNSSDSLSGFSLRYQLFQGSVATSFRPFALRHLPHTSCLVAANLTARDPPNQGYSEIRLSVESDDGRKNPVVYSARRPWKPSKVVDWRIESTRTLLSSLTFIDRWLVSGLVRMRQDASDEQVDIGDALYPLHPVSTSECVTSTDVEDASAAKQDGCFSFSGLYIGSNKPSLALIKAGAECDRSPDNCHFAAVLPNEVNFRLPILWVVLLFLIGSLLQIVVEGIRRKPLDFKAMFGPEERGPVLLRAISCGMLLVWFAEALLWTPEHASAQTRITEIVVPVLIGFSAVFFPAQLRPLLRFIGWIR